MILKKWILVGIRILQDIELMYFFNNNLNYLYRGAQKRFKIIFGAPSFIHYW